MSKTDITVGALVSKVASNELRLPEMQRGYIWRDSQVRDLLDSLYRGYPTGTILVWETASAPQRDMAVGGNSSAFKTHQLLLDGQQRLTSLSAVFMGLPIDRRTGANKKVEILFNLDHPDDSTADVAEEEQNGKEADEDDEKEDEGSNIQKVIRRQTFVVATKALSNDPRWVNVTDVLANHKTDVQILKPLVQSLDDPNFARYANRLQQLRKIRDYQYVMIVLERELSYEEVAVIFVRVNSLGTRLRGSDLALALITSRWEGSLRELEEFRQHCEDKGHFSFELGLLVRALVVFATGQSRFKSVSTISIERLKSAWAETKRAMEFSFDFLKANAGIDSEALLSSPLFVITIAFWVSFKKYKLTSHDERTLLHWLYVANAHGHYSGSTETVLDADLTRIKNGEDVEGLLQALKRDYGRLEFTAADLAGRNQRSPLFPMAFLALRARGAKDWRTKLAPSLTTIGSRNSIEFHHIFPKTRLTKANYKRDEINDMANLAFIGAATNKWIGSHLPETYLAEVLANQGKDLAEQGVQALTSHCIPLEPELWKLDNFGKFLEHRRNDLANAINEFISPPSQAIDVAKLIAGGEAEDVEFKSSARWDYHEAKYNKTLESVVVKTIASLLNAKGGFLLIGVDDKGQVLGLAPDYATLSGHPNADGYQQFLVNLITSTLGKDVIAYLSIAIKPVDDKEVGVVKVMESSKPIYVEKGRFYCRAGTTTQELGTEEAIEYIKVRWPS
ncbi:MAG: DUF262 domain-containing protein [Candidatus Binataceae bacterium]